MVYANNETDIWLTKKKYIYIYDMICLTSNGEWAVSNLTQIILRHCSQLSLLSSLGHPQSDYIKTKQMFKIF